MLQPTAQINAQGSMKAYCKGDAFAAARSDVGDCDWGSVDGSEGSTEVNSEDGSSIYSPCRGPLCRQTSPSTPARRSDCSGSPDEERQPSDGSASPGSAQHLSRISEEIGVAAPIEQIFLESFQQEEDAECAAEHVDYSSVPEYFAEKDGLCVDSGEEGALQGVGVERRARFAPVRLHRFAPALSARNTRGLNCVFGSLAKDGMPSIFASCAQEDTHLDRLPVDYSSVPEYFAEKDSFDTDCEEQQAGGGAWRARFAPGAAAWLAPLTRSDRFS